MPVKQRPYFRSSIGELEEIAANGNAKCLAELHAELCHRKSQRAMRLKGKIEERLAQLGVQNPKTASDHPVQLNLIPPATPQKRRLMTIDLEKHIQKAEPPEAKPEQIAPPPPEPEKKRIQIGLLLVIAGAILSGAFLVYLFA